MKLPVVFVSMIPFVPPLADTLVKDSVPPVPLRFTAVPVDVVTLISLTVTPVTAPPLRPVALPVLMFSALTVTLLVRVMVPVTVGLLVAAIVRPWSVNVVPWPHSVWPVSRAIPPEVFPLPWWTKMYWLASEGVSAAFSVVKGRCYRPSLAPLAPPYVMFTYHTTSLRLIVTTAVSVMLLPSVSV